MKRSSGFTLVELLIASSILAMLIGASTWAYSFFSQYWQRLSSADNQLVQRTVAVTRLRETLAGILNYQVEVSETEQAFYFHGTARELIAATSNSLFFPGQAAAIHIQLIDRGDQQWQLQYSESRFSEFLPMEPSQQPDQYENSFSLEFDGRRPRFTYLGWLHSQALLGDSESGKQDLDIKKARWSERYTDAQLASLPVGLKLTFIHAGNDINYGFRLTDTLSDMLGAASGE